MQMLQYLSLEIVAQSSALGVLGPPKMLLWPRERIYSPDGELQLREESTLGLGDNKGWMVKQKWL